MKIFGGGGEGNFHWSDPLDYYIRRMQDEAKATTFINDHALDPSYPSDACSTYEYMAKEREPRWGLGI